MNTQTQKEQGDVKTEAEAEVMLPSAKDRLGPQQREEARKSPPSAPSEAALPCHTWALDFRPPERGENKLPWV